ncbi:MAG: polyprenyl synthetase family protein [Candidatus Korarchaeota archaeon]|nr:polyprenyl synthetase family protein [Candidatus Korarchaeota archaeon]NIU82837.1 hypothetical protein [Candidatus Thorarchaeota archaeon]NIW13320.1 hypothetical protein [Candidatus Thorarchaeota archaeon]NIW51426.1 hypothetical protein [Candidatus Korarchaeota archaeon]
MEKEKILTLLKRYRAEIVDPYMKDKIRELHEKQDLKNLYDAMIYHLETGGKRWRPTLCILICEAFGGKIEEALPLASAIELHHNWTLIHDDIEDGDEVRRDQPTVWKKYGLAHGINVGDAMNEVAYLVLSEGREKWGETVYADVHDLIHKHLIRITEGQTMDMNFRHQEDISEEEYMEMVTRKTGDLVVVAAVGGAIIGEAPQEAQNALKKYSYTIGPAFQIRDDLLDYTKGKGRGGKIGNDVREGKRSLMVVHAFNHLTPEKKRELVRILDTPREETTREDVDRAKELMRSCGAFNHAEKKQKKLAKDAEEIVKKHIPQSNAEDLLLGLSQFLIKRTL